MLTAAGTELDRAVRDINRWLANATTEAGASPYEPFNEADPSRCVLMPRSVAVGGGDSLVCSLCTQWHPLPENQHFLAFRLTITPRHAAIGSPCDLRALPSSEPSWLLQRLVIKLTSDSQQLPLVLPSQGGVLSQDQFTWQCDIPAGNFWPDLRPQLVPRPC
ncbi:MAG TPA: hypothetical protein VLI05_04090 [Candidatus Saccharimonadia bacterium]|nr:hypothetical protein [Candidatus Saccharimonadia bacterium]